MVDIDDPDVSEVNKPLNLKSLRESKGISLSKVFQATRVSTINLEAIESENFRQLPTPVIARSFIRHYARAIGIDARDILDRYEQYLESLRSSPPAKKAEKAEILIGGKPRWILWAASIAIIVVLVISVLIMIWQPRKSPQSKAPMAGKEVQQVIPAQDAARGIPANAAPLPALPPAASPGQEGGSSPQAKPPGQGIYYLVVQASELTWLRITEDRNPSFQILLKPGEKIERQASEFFDLDIGNAAGVELTFQGKSLGRLGNPAQVIHMRLPQSSVPMAP